MKTRKSLPPLKSLRAFQIAGRHLSFKDAADELFLTASAVSHQVKNLEEYLGIELFLRKTRALELTDREKSILNSWTKCLRGWNRKRTKCGRNTGAK